MIYHKHMNRFALCVFLLLILFASCGSAPVAEPEPEPVIPPPVEQEQPVEVSDEPVTVSKEVYEQTLAEVKLFIENLNKSIGAKNYASWKNSLSDEYFARISSLEFLEAASESPLLKIKKVVLKTPVDYFSQVVVPSRANSRVDEIDFSGEDTIKAYYLETRTKKDENDTSQTETRRLRLYELAKFGEDWKIIN